MTFNDAEEIVGVLQRLGNRLLYEYAKPIALVVCGGSALNVLNIASRNTSAGFRGRVRRTVEALGYEDISKEIPQ